jgi:hypothetical protein
MCAQWFHWAGNLASWRCLPSGKSISGPSTQKAGPHRHERPVHEEYHEVYGFVAQVAIGDVRHHLTRLQQAVLPVGMNPAVGRILSVGGIIHGRHFESMKVYLERLEKCGHVCSGNKVMYNSQRENKVSG